MTPPLHTQLMPQLRQRSAIVCACVLVCLVSQSLLPGLTITWPTSPSGDSADASGCCVVDLADAAFSGCCCGPDAESSCGCSCVKDSAHSQTVADANDRSSQPGRTFESEICGCGGKHRAGFISSVDPAVLPVADFPLDRRTNPALPELTTSWFANRVAPPTPPPEFVA